MDNINEELSIEEIVKLESKCSKKVFNNFIEQKFKSQFKTEPVKKTKDDLEYEKVFGCERQKKVKPKLDKKVLELLNDKYEKINEEDKPEELTTKFRPPKLRPVFEITKKETELRDPRFDKSSGFFNPKRFEKSYHFIKEARQKDKVLLKKTLKKTNNEERKKEISKVIQRIENQEKTEKQQLKKQELKNQLVEEKKQNIKNRTDKPIFISKGEIKKKELVENFKELKKNKKLNKYLERKRKKNTSREKKSFLGNV